MTSTNQKHGATTMNHTTSNTSSARTTRNRFGFKKRQPAIVQPGREAFIATIQSELRSQCLARSENGASLTYFQAIAIGQHLRQQYRDRMGLVPAPVDATLELGVAILAPSRKQARKHLRAALLLAGSCAGTHLLLTNLAVALGWKTGVLSSIKTWAVGTSLTAPIASMVAGGGLLLGACYFIIDGTGSRARERRAAIATERYIRTLSKGLKAATPMTWVERQIAPFN